MGLFIRIFEKSDQKWVEEKTAKERELEWMQKDDRVVRRRVAWDLRQTSQIQKGKPPKCCGLHLAR